MDLRRGTRVEGDTFSRMLFEIRYIDCIFRREITCVTRNIEDEKFREDEGYWYQRVSWGTDKILHIQRNSFTWVTRNIEDEKLTENAAGVVSKSVSSGTKIRFHTPGLPESE